MYLFMKLILLYDFEEPKKGKAKSYSFCFTISASLKIVKQSASCLTLLAFEGVEKVYKLLRTIMLTLPANPEATRRRRAPATPGTI